MLRSTTTAFCLTFLFSLGLGAAESSSTNSAKLTVEVDKKKASALFVIPLPDSKLLGRPTEELSDLPGAKITTYEDETGASFAAVRVPLRYVLKKANSPTLTLGIPGKNGVQFLISSDANTVKVFVASPTLPEGGYLLVSPR